MREDLEQTDEAAAAFLRGLICNKEARLAGSGQLDEITEHDYFEDFCWDHFRAHTMKPPPTPPNKVSGATSDHLGFFQSEVGPYAGDDCEFEGFTTSE